MRLGVCVALTLLVGCGGDDASGGGSGGSGGSGATGGYVGVDPNTDCPGKLEPREPAGHVETVGDGTPGSCTEQALHDAVAAVNGAPDGGTVLFDCGGAHTIELTSSVYVTATAIVDRQFVEVIIAPTVSPAAQEIRVLLPTPRGVRPVRHPLANHRGRESFRRHP